MKLFPEIPNGCVLVARKIIYSSLFTMRPEDFKLAIYCICNANHKDGEWFDGKKVIIIKRGQFITSLDKLSAFTKLSAQVIRTSLKHLKSTQFLTVEATETYSVISVDKYDHYQNLLNYSNKDINTDDNKDLTKSQHRPNKDLTTNNKGNNDNKGNNNTNIDAKASTPIDITDVVKTVLIPKDIKPNKPEVEYNSRDMIWYFGNKFLAIVEYPYPANFGKDGKIFKDLLKIYDAKTILNMIDVFFHCAKDEGAWTQDKLSVGVFRTQASKLLIKIREIKTQKEKIQNG